MNNLKREITLFQIITNRLTEPARIVRRWPYCTTYIFLPWITMFSGFNHDATACKEHVNALWNAASLKRPGPSKMKRTQWMRPRARINCTVRGSELPAKKDKTTGISEITRCNKISQWSSKLWSWFETYSGVSRLSLYIFLKSGPGVIFQHGSSQKSQQKKFHPWHP